MVKRTGRSVRQVRTCALVIVLELQVLSNAWGFVFDIAQMGAGGLSRAFILVRVCQSCVLHIHIADDVTPTL